MSRASWKWYTAVRLGVLDRQEGSIRIVEASKLRDVIEEKIST